MESPDKRNLLEENAKPRTLMKELMFRKRSTQRSFKTTMNQELPGAAACGSIAMKKSGAGSLHTAAQRVYSDYIHPDRYSLYDELLSTAKRYSYTIISVGEFWRMAGCTDSAKQNSRVLVLRHDIDTSPQAALYFASAEARHSARASYFFRLSTEDRAVMRHLAKIGHEVGYHYEELATLAKEKNITKVSGVSEILDAARHRFAENLRAMRARTGLPLRAVASHGDFVNRALKTPNTLVLADSTLRRDCNIEFEAYDPEVEERISFRVSDAPYPVYWLPRDPIEAIQMGISPTFVLTHPRNWGRDIVPNAREDLKRLWEDLIYRRGVRCG